MLRLRAAIAGIGGRLQLERPAAFGWNGWPESVEYAVGARRAEITRMASAFEHEDLQAALKL